MNVEQEERVKKLDQTMDKVCDLMIFICVIVLILLVVVS